MRLKLNADKTKCIQFRPQKQLKKNGKEPVMADSDLIQMNNVVRYLGTFLDQSLTFNNHISQKIKAATGNFTERKSLRKYLSKDVCATLVCMLCISHLDYGYELLYGLFQKSMNWYQLVKNICAKLILNRSKYSSPTDELHTLHWLPIQERIQFKILTLTYKCLENKALKYITNLIIVKKPGRENLQSDYSGNLLEIPHIGRQKVASRSFSCAAPTLWNSLPNSICQAPLLDKFKSPKKTHLFK